MVAHCRGVLGAVEELLLLLDADVVPVDGDLARWACWIFQRYGKGQGHGAQVNFGAADDTTCWWRRIWSTLALRATGGARRRCLKGPGMADCRPPGDLRALRPPEKPLPRSGRGRSAIGFDWSRMGRVARKRKAQPPDGGIQGFQPGVLGSEQLGFVLDLFAVFPHPQNFVLDLRDLALELFRALLDLAHGSPVEHR